MNIYKTLRYRLILRSFLDERKKQSIKNTYGSFAKQINVQPTYLTRVLKEDAHLNADQLFNAIEQLALPESVAQYLVLLHEYDNSQLAHRKAKLLEKIKEIQKKSMEVKGHLEAKMVEPLVEQDLHKYYLDPLIQVIHVALTIPKFAENYHLIAPALQISSSRLLYALKILEDCHLIKMLASGHSCKVILDHLYLDKNSFFSKTYLQLMRALSQRQVNDLDPKDLTSCSVTISIDPEAQDRIRQEFFKFLKMVESLVRDAKSEHLMQLNFDFFPWEKEK